MAFSRNVLVILDASAENQQRALERSALIAKRMQANLEVLWLHNPTPEHSLKQQLAAYGSEGISISELYQDQNGLIKALLKRWEADPFALLVKSCDASHRSLMAPLDWQLLRQAPCPVLLVKQDKLWEGGEILSAINPFARKPGTQALNRAILHMAAFISREVSASLNLAISYAPPMLGAEPENQSASLLEQKARDKAQTFISNMRLPPVTYRVGEGPPEYWIPHAANTHQAALVVMGTHAREGIKGALLGNTAERILDRLSCDVLVLREGLGEAVERLLKPKV